MQTERSDKDHLAHNPSGPGKLLGGMVALILMMSAMVLAGEPPDDLFLNQIASGLIQPVDIKSAGDDSGRVFVVERRGTIRVILNDVLQPGFFLDIQTAVDDAGTEQGLLGLAFHPQFADNGRFYVNYTRDPGPGSDRTVIEEYIVTAVSGPVAILGSPTTILEIAQGSSNHNGGGLAFGPDGYLYVGMGDGGGANDQPCNAQKMNTLLGKMVRISVDGGGVASDCGLVGNYTIPNSNPFRDGAGGNCDEIWSLGLRNPWRWSFDRFTGDMFIGDVGQLAREEISYEPWGSPGGLNFGWKVMEGNLCGTDFPDNDCPVGTPPCHHSSYTDPIIDYGRSVGNVVSGGYVYRGSKIGGIQGSYFYADNGSGRIWIATPNSVGGWSTVEWDHTSFNIPALGEDEAGELYLVDYDFINSAPTAIYRFESPSSIFGDQFESSDTSIWSAVVP